MDILNFISWIKGKRLVTTVDPAKTLIPVGLKDGRRDDEYLAGAITVQNLLAQVTPVLPYKVYTALLTQSGSPSNEGLNSGELTIGVTYTINTYSEGDDFTNVGAPSNIDGVSFVATGTTPNTWIGGTTLVYNTGAPVVTVLENTIGNIHFTYNGVGYYIASSEPESLFPVGKTVCFLGSVGDDSASPAYGFLRLGGSDQCRILTQINNTNEDNVLFNTPIEIRVYN